MAEDEARVTNRGWRWPLGPIRILIIATALLSVVFLIFPGLDLWFSRQFYDAEIGFPALRIHALNWLRDVSGLLLWAAGAIVVISLLGKLLVFPRRRPLVPGRAMLFLSATLALSAGLLVNGILKSLWGRPRPTQVFEFGGDAPFVTAWHISDFCARNCSFVSGEGSAAIWLVAIALVVPSRFRRVALFTSVALASAFSLNRIAFGGHFLSDVLIAWTLTLLVIAVAYHFLYVRPPRFLEEEAIDRALTRAGLWLRGLVARRTREEQPLHPEAVAVLSAEEITTAHRLDEAPPQRPGYRPTRQVFAGPAEPVEEPEVEHPGDPSWNEDTHRDADESDGRQEPVLPESRDDVAPAGAEPSTASFPAPSVPSPGEPASPEGVVPAERPVLAAPDDSIESIDPEPEEIPPPTIASDGAVQTALEAALLDLDTTPEHAATPVPAVGETAVVSSGRSPDAAGATPPEAAPGTASDAEVVSETVIALPAPIMEPGQGGVEAAPAGPLPVTADDDRDDVQSRPPSPGHD